MIFLIKPNGPRGWLPGSLFPSQTVLYAAIGSTALLLASVSSAAEQSRIAEGLIKTSKGDIRILLYSDLAPISVANFIRYAQEGRYAGGSFYRATNDQPTSHGVCCISIVQGGRLGSSMAGVRNDVYQAFAQTVFPPIAHEPTDVTGLEHQRGAISFARLALGSASSEFFISTKDNPILDAGGNGHPDGKGYAVFGEVLSGLEIIDALVHAPRKEGNTLFAGQLLVEPITIIDIEIEK